MSDTGIYASTADIQYKAGANASAVSKAEAYTNVYVAMAEGVINVLCRKVFAADAAAFTALPASTRNILRDCASSLAAMYVVLFDMGGYSSRTEAEDMLNVLRDSVWRDLKFLEDRKNQDFLMTGVSA